jgi:hypothetical protein
MTSGFFHIAFTGSAGSGFGILVFRDGIIAGADVGGALYDGNYTENSTTGDLEIRVTMAARAGITLVQTGVPLAEPTSVPITARVSQAELMSETPVLIESPIGPVNVIFRKIRD